MKIAFRYGSSLVHIPNNVVFLAYLLSGSKNNSSNNKKNILYDVLTCWKSKKKY